MFNRPNRNDVDDGVQDIQNDVNQLADSLESVLKSWGSDAKGEAEAAQAARDAVGCADSFVRERPWCSVGTAAAVGIFIGALLSMRKS